MAQNLEFHSPFGEHVAQGKHFAVDYEQIKENIKSEDPKTRVIAYIEMLGEETLKTEVRQLAECALQTIKQCLNIERNMCFYKNIVRGHEHDLVEIRMAKLFTIEAEDQEAQEFWQDREGRIKFSMDGNLEFAYQEQIQLDEWIDILMDYEVKLKKLATPMIMALKEEEAAR